MWLGLPNPKDLPPYDRVVQLVGDRVVGERARPRPFSNLGALSPPPPLSPSALTGERKAQLEREQGGGLAQTAANLETQTPLAWAPLASGGGRRLTVSEPAPSRGRRG